jgi:hypothetical protein
VQLHVFGDFIDRRVWGSVDVSIVDDRYLLSGRVFSNLAIPWELLSVLSKRRELEREL